MLKFVVLMSILDMHNGVKRCGFGIEDWSTGHIISSLYVDLELGSLLSLSLV